MAYKRAVAAVDTAGGAFSIANPEGVDILIRRVMVHVTTVATAAGTLSVGVGTGATTSYANLIDTVDVNAATGVFDNIKSKGTNGKECQVWPAASFVTGSKASGALAGLVANVYLDYVTP